jgi:hypothetical protein
MGIRGELYSTRVSCEGRTYFFNVKENRMGDLFLTIVESKPTEAETFDRRSIVLFRDDVPDFLKAFQAALGFLAKPGEAPAALDFARKDGGPASSRRALAGFAGSPEGAGAPGAAPAKKRKIVVKKKTSSDGEKPST